MHPGRRRARYIREYLAGLPGALQKARFSPVAVQIAANGPPIGNLKDSLGGEIAINPSDPRIILAGSRSGRCWLSRDAGETWAVCLGPTGQVLTFHFDRTRQGR